MTRLLRTFLPLYFTLLCVPIWAQMPGAVPIEINHRTVTKNGRCYYVHIVQRGQTVYSITRAYGKKERDAMVKTDVNFIAIGDTVWIPCGGVLQEDTRVKPLVAKEKPTEVKNNDNVVANNHDNNKEAATAKKRNTATTAEENNAGTTTTSRVNADATYQTPSSTSSSAKPQYTPNKIVQQANDEPATISPRIDPSRIVVSLLLPLNLDQMETISTSKFDVEQRGKTTYKPLEFIQFYEGILMALDKLESEGISVTLNVVDVPDNNPATVDRLFASHDVAQSDFVIALLTKQPFDRIAELCRVHKIMVINPMATRGDIVEHNPYLFKYTPSEQSKIEHAIKQLHHEHPASAFLIIHSGTTADKMEHEYAMHIIDSIGHGNITYATLNWAKTQALQPFIQKNPNTIVLSLNSQDPSRTRIYASTLLNKLSSKKNQPSVLVTLDDWTTIYKDIDFNQLQQLEYHTFYRGWDNSNPDHVLFVENFRDRFKTEPTENFSAIGHDIMLYFATGLSQMDTNFWHTPVIDNVPGILMPLSFKSATPWSGHESNRPILYRMENYLFRRVK